MPSVFSEIIAGKLPCTKVFENEHILAFKDIYPHAPVHILIVPKKEVADLQSLQPEDYFLIQEVVAAAQHLAREFHLEDGYRLLTNNGSDAGQTVFHLHFHLIGGKKLANLV